MKNNLLYLIFLIFLFTVKSNILFAENEFVFKSSSIEITEDGNNIIAKNGVEIVSKDGLKIFSDESNYSKL